MSAETGKVNKTDLLKQHIQAIIKQNLGVKVSKEKAWQLFKAVIMGTVELTFNVEGKQIPLSGVGTFEVLETKPRGSKAGLDENGNPIDGAKPWPYVPRFRFYPSSNIDNLMEQKCGLADHGIEEKHYGIYALNEEAAETETSEEDTADVVDNAACETPVIDETDEI